MKISLIIGARPQFIKLAPLYSKLKQNNELILVHTGQHFDKNMSEIFFDELGLPTPEYNFNIHDGTHGEQTAKMLMALEKNFLETKPDLVMVFGDTNSTLAGALAASKLHIPVAHIEAGLRSFDRKMPEEVNRVLTDHISSYLFVPTQTGVDNLKNEGITERVYLTGDIMYDAVLHFSEIAKKESKILDDLGLEPGKYHLATIHRPSNTDNYQNLRSIFNALEKSSLPVVLPLHPRTKKALVHIAQTGSSAQLKLIPPCSYLDMLMLSINAKKIITDSGGLQKEAYYLKKPCVTVRDTTEWVETLENNWNILALDKADEVDEKKLIEYIEKEQKTGEWNQFFGDGKTVEKIIFTLREHGGSRS